MTAVLPEKKSGAHASRGDDLKSFDPEAFGRITGTEEFWRFTPLDRLRGLDREAPTADLPAPSATLPDGVTVERVGRDDPRIGSAGVPGDRISAEAWAAFQEATVLTVPRGWDGGDVVTLTYGEPGRAASADGAHVAGHLVVEIGELAHVVIVLDRRGTGTIADNVEIVAGDGAHATVVTVHDFDRDAVYAGAHFARLGRDTVLKHVVVTLGGDLVRVTPEVDFAAPGGDVDLLGVYFADAGQHFEQRLFTDHSVPNCKSRTTYKGALQGKDAHTVWVGDVLIRSDADNTDTYEQNRNLVLSEGARADSVPNLEIEDGEIVGAGHAAATGRFDELQMFYLQSRGIPEAEARRMVVLAFFADVIGRIAVPSLEDRLMASIESELEHTVLAPAGESAR